MKSPETRSEDSPPIAAPAGERCEADPRLRLDCRHYRGDRPCAAGEPTACPTSCKSYARAECRILIVKIGALGDVIRTAALLPGLRKRWPLAHVTWVTSAAGARMLANHPQIDRLLAFDAWTPVHLECETFDLCLSLDKEPGPAALAMRVPARARRGIGLSRYGTPYPLTPECRHYFELGLDNALKFHVNRKSYPHLIYEAVGLTYQGERFRLFPDAGNLRRAAALFESHGLRGDDRVVGLNTGAGGVFANKTWPPEKFAVLARALAQRGDCRVLLLGGPAEALHNARIARDCADLRTPGGDAMVVDSGGNHAELDFAAIVARCTVLVTGDSMALHVALAADVPVVALFGPTCPQEIDLYGHGTRVVARVPCAPCYKRTCDRSPTCMDDISIERVLAAARRWLRAAPGRPLPILACSV